MTRLSPLLLFLIACGDDPAVDSAPQCNEWSISRDYVYAMADWEERCDPDRAGVRASKIQSFQRRVVCHPIDACLLEECVRELAVTTDCIEPPAICEAAIDDENPWEGCE